MPVYGHSFLRDKSVWVKPQIEKLSPKQVKRWQRLWHPSMYLGYTTIPVMFLNGTNDFAYPLDSDAKTTALVTGEKDYSI